MSDVDARAAWERWRESRDRAVRSPGGALALTGTHWFDDVLELDGVPGRWQVRDGRVRLTAGAGDGVVVDGHPLVGTADVRSDLADDATDVRAGGVRLVLIDREGALAVRVYDPNSPALQAFEGIDRFAFDERWVREATFTPYDAERVVRIPHVDGVERGLPLGGEIAFELDGTQIHLAVEVEPESGEMQAVVSDATSGDSTYRFRFLDLDAPDGDGRVVADLNRLRLPPCAFSDHFVCPLPPPGNRLDIPLEAGEKLPLGSHPH
ncbi:MAG TPA: DUF1684 domain-containing protein [Angustibacter sp.]|nr:DUF1684 domain-containing protein [Angustibacter sp.]